jgi:hypothetical protein
VDAEQEPRPEAPKPTRGLKRGTRAGLRLSCTIGGFIVVAVVALLYAIFFAAT